MPAQPSDGVYTFKPTDHFRRWTDGLDTMPKALVAARIAMARRGIPGKLLKDTGGIYELSVDTGPGYRLYYCQTGRTTFLLLTGGIKDDQLKDIKTAMKLHGRVKGGEHV